jgi:hypothetical protein
MRLLFHDTPLIMLDEPSAPGSRERVQVFAPISMLAQEAQVGSREELERKAGVPWPLYLA